MANVNEIWQPVKGHEGIYEISNFGQIKCCGNFYGKRRPNKKMHPSKTKAGYLRIPLNNGTKRITYQVHRLVALSFIPNPDNLPTVNHINGIKTDNRVENLEWCSYSDNLKHAYDNKLLISKRNSSHYAAKKVIHKSGLTFGCIKEAANHFGIKHMTLVNQLLRNLKSDFKYL